MGDFQNIFKRLRNSCGLTQAEMAEKLGISRSTIGMYETEQRVPRDSTKIALAKYYKTTVQKIFFTEDVT